MARLTWNLLACIGFVAVLCGTIAAASIALTYTDWYGH